jgi:hypothetical protein
MSVEADTLRTSFERAGVRAPNTFIVGAPKCATTAMGEALARHPSLFMSPTKEPHHFGADLPALRIRTLMPADDYVALFRGATDETAVAEASVWTMRSAVAASEIATFEPRARILVMLRDPVEAVASLHGELCRAGVEDILDLRTALEAEDDRRAGHRIARGVERFGQLLYTDAVAFADQIQRFIAAFGPAALHVVLLDDIRRDAAEVMDRVQQFLDVDPSPQVCLPVANEGRVVRLARLQRFARQRGVARSVTRRLVPARARPRIARTVVDSIDRLNLSEGGRPPIPEDLEAELRERFRDDVDRLATMIGRDLSAWR